MSTTCEVNIPQYLDSLGLRSQRAGLSEGVFQVYDVEFRNEEHCVNAGQNLPWSFSLTKVYQLFVKLIAHLSYSTRVECTFYWARNQLIQIGKNELQSFFNAHKDHGNSNLHSSYEGFIYVAAKVEPLLS